MMPCQQGLFLQEEERGSDSETEKEREREGEIEIGQLIILYDNE